MNIFELFGTIGIKNKDANEALKDTAQKAEKTGKQIQEAFKKVGSASLKVGKAVIGAGSAIATAWTATIETSRDYRTAMAKLDTAFTTNGHSAETATKTYKALQAVLGETDQAVEAANHLAVMCKTEEELANWTDICTGVYAQFGDSLPIEGLTESANETAKVGQVTGSLADALNWAGISEDDFNLKLKTCRNEQERQKLIMDTLLPTYKAQAESYKENAENIMAANTAQDNLNSALAKIGEIGEPILTGLKGWFADMVNEAAPYLQTLVDKLVNFDDTMTNEVWPWIQQEAKMRFGVDLPDWETFKSDVSTWWETTKTNIGKLVDDAAFVLRCMGIGEWTEEDTERLRLWWDGVYAKCVEVCKWVLDPPELPDPDTMVAKITGWWEGVKSRFSLTFGVKPQVYTSAIQSVSTGSAVADEYIKATTVNPDAPWASGLMNLFRPNGSKASGMDYVHRDGYLARVHKGEAILNAVQADAWRGGNTSAIEAKLDTLIAVMSGSRPVVLETGAMVGQLAPAMDARLGTISSRKGRRN